MVSAFPAEPSHWPSESISLCCFATACKVGAQSLCTELTHGNPPLKMACFPYCSKSVYQGALTNCNNSVHSRGQEPIYREYVFSECEVPEGQVHIRHEGNTGQLDELCKYN